MFTKDFGLISALATGVRKSESKLRYTLQEYSVCQVSLVKGKSTWRITSALLEKNLYIHTEVSTAKDVIARICTQVIRLVAGQEKDEQLFDTVLIGLHKLSVAPTDTVVSLDFS